MTWRRPTPSHPAPVRRGGPSDSTLRTARSTVGRWCRCWRPTDRQQQRTLRAFIGGLRTELAEAPSLTRSARHRYHQAFMLYALVMQGLLMSVRPSNQPERPFGGSARARQVARQRGTSSQPRREALTTSTSPAPAQWRYPIDYGDGSPPDRPRRGDLALATGRSGHPVDNAGTEPVPGLGRRPQGLMPHVVDVQWLTPAGAVRTSCARQLHLAHIYMAHPRRCAEQVVDAFLAMQQWARARWGCTALSTSHTTSLKSARALSAWPMSLIGTGAVPARGPRGQPFSGPATFEP